jgi:hypothetical protein
MGYIYQMWLLYQSAFLFLDGDDITWSSYVLVISLIDFPYIYISKFVTVFSCFSTWDNISLVGFNYGTGPLR